MSKRWEPIRLRRVGGMPQYEAGSDGKCFNIRQGVRGRSNNGKSDLLTHASTLYGVAIYNDQSTDYISTIETGHSIAFLHFVTL